MRTGSPRGGSGFIGLRPAPATLTVMLGLAAIFTVDALLGRPAWVREHLALTPRRALGPEPWQLLTASLVHLQGGALLSSLITLWFFGSPAELALGRWGLVRVLGAGALGAGLAVAGLGRLVTPDLLWAGAAAATTATLAAFGVAYGRTPLFLFGVQETRASSVALFFIGLAALVHLMAGDLVGLAAVLAAALAGWAACRAFRPEAVVLGNGLGGLRGVGARLRRWRIRRRYRVLPGGRDTRHHLN